MPKLGQHSSDEIPTYYLSATECLGNPILLLQDSQFSLDNAGIVGHNCCLFAWLALL